LIPALEVVAELDARTLELVARALHDLYMHFELVARALHDLYLHFELVARALHDFMMHFELVARALLGLASVWLSHCVKYFET